jgi:hypothetical protein
MQTESITDQPMTMRRLKSLSIVHSVPGLKQLRLGWTDGREEFLDFSTIEGLMRRYLELYPQLPALPYLYH